MDAGFAPILFVLLVSMTAVRSQIRKGPSNALKKVGDSVMLECVTVNKNCDQVDWAKVEGLQSPKLVFRNGNGKLNNDLYPPQRYSVNSTGGCSLAITQLEINDSGRFICMQAVDSREETRSSILVVIDVAESCESNVTGNALDKGDGYNLWCTINIPPKSLEPSNVTLSFHNKAVGETETTDENQPLIVKTTLTGIATNENITRVCRASFPHNTQANYDSTTAILDICATQQFIVSHPVENIAISLCPYTVRCTADGHPLPTFKWKHLKSTAAVDGDILEIKGAAGNTCTCTATNTFKGKIASQNITIEVCPPTPPTTLQSGIRKGPANALKKVGDSVTLKCVTVNKNCDQVDWQKVEGMQSPKLVYRNGQGMLNNDLYPPQRYSVNSTGGCSITIRQLEINDSGTFICVHAVGDTEQRRTSILAVIDVRESCLSNVTSNAMDKDDGYSFWCTIKVPPKSVEPSNVTLSFHNKIVGETETTDENQPLIVKTTLTGTATKENITQRVCRASFLPTTEANYDNTNAILDVCTTQSLTVSHHVESNTVLTPGPSEKSDVCFWPDNGDLHSPSKSPHPKRDAVDNNTLVITDVEGKTCTIIATKFKRRVDSEEVSSSLDSSQPTLGPGGIVGIAAGILGSGMIGAASYAGLRDERSRLYDLLHSKKKKNEEDGETAAYVPVTDSASSGPVKPPQDG